jgi:solute carrier family 25 (mitochondrial iron transporter), member 28/37
MSQSDADDDLEWEEWNPQKITFVKHMIAGSAAGLTEHISVFPIDTLKTHVQCERCGSTSPFQTWNCATKIVKQEGVFRLWRGVSAMFAGCIPAHAAYFTIFETMKIWLGADRDGHHPIQAAACGVTAALAHDMSEY